MDVMTLEDQGGFRDVRVACVGAGADEDLLDGLFRDLAERFHIVREVRAGHKRLKRGHVKLDHLVVLGVLVRKELCVILRAALGGEELLHLLVRRENGRRSPHLGTHICDGGALGDLQSCRTRAYILVDFAETALDALTAEHLEDDLLGVDAGFKLTGEVDFDYFGHFEAHRDTGHRGGHVHAADADAEHADRAAVRCVAVAAHADLAGDAEAGDMHGVADAVAGAGDVDAVLFGCALQVNMIVRGHIVDVEEIVV